MALIGELLIGVLAPALQSVATVKLTELFEKLAAKDPSAHAATMKALHIGVDELDKLTIATTTKIDDAVVNAMQAAVLMSAAIHSVILDK